MMSMKKALLVAVAFSATASVFGENAFTRKKAAKIATKYAKLGAAGALGFAAYQAPERIKEVNAKIAEFAGIEPGALFKAATVDAALHYGIPFVLKQYNSDHVKGLAHVAQALNWVSLVHESKRFEELCSKLPTKFQLPVIKLIMAGVISYVGTEAANKASAYVATAVRPAPRPTENMGEVYPV